MIHNIRDAFNKLLEEIDWMDDKTRDVARQKAAAITEKIGYPEYIVNDTAINLDYEGVRTNQWYKNTRQSSGLHTLLCYKNLQSKTMNVILQVSMDEDNYFENVLNLLNTMSRNNLKQLRDPVDRTKWV